MNSTTKVIPKRICPICFRMFTPNTKHQKYCAYCGKHNKYEIKLYAAGLLKRPYRENEKLHKMNAEIEAYNKKHGTCLTYGKYIQYKNAGWLED